MPRKLAEGDQVQIADREPTPADTKSQLFFAHYRGARGTLSKLYADGTALVIADTGSMPDDVRSRHDAGTTAMRQKWLDGLSDEARNRLSSAEKKFALRYSILVAQEDVRSEGPAPAPTAEVKAPDAAAPPPKGEEAPVLDLDMPPASRKSLDEIEADEARHLSEVRQKKGRSS